MAHLIDKAAVVAEIEKKLQDLIVCKKDAFYAEERVTLRAKINMCKEILSSLETLEVKEDDLEKEIKEEYLKHRCYGGRDNMLVILNEPQFNKITKHFIELGLSSQLSWQDVKKLAEIGEAFMNSEESDNLSEEEYYTEILNKFKVQK